MRQPSEVPRAWMCSTGRVSPWTVQQYPGNAKLHCLSAGRTQPKIRVPLDPNAESAFVLPPFSLDGCTARERVLLCLRPKNCQCLDLTRKNRVVSGPPNMPPKRASPSETSGRASGQNKKAKPSGSKAEPKAKPKAASSRWSAVSASRNADENYKFVTNDPARAYAYECLCSIPSVDGGGDDDDDDDDSEDGDTREDESDDANSKPRTKCDGGRACLCGKPSTEHPDHPLILTYAGSQKRMVQHVFSSLRDPDNFDMYTYNDHYGCGLLEVVQNLFLDFEEANSNWREQWAVCEGMVTFLLSNATMPMMMYATPRSPSP